MEWLVNYVQMKMMIKWNGSGDRLPLGWFCGVKWCTDGFLDLWQAQYQRMMRFRTLSRWESLEFGHYHRLNHITHRHLLVNRHLPSPVGSRSTERRLLVLKTFHPAAIIMPLLPSSCCVVGFFIEYLLKYADLAHNKTSFTFTISVTTGGEGICFGTALRANSGRYCQRRSFSLNQEHAGDLKCRRLVCGGWSLDQYLLA